MYLGSSAIHTATPDIGYHFVNWTDGSGNALSPNDPAQPNVLQLMNVAADQSITANFAIDTFEVTFAAGIHGTLTGVTDQIIDYDANATAVTAVPDTGYHFVNWTGTGGFVTSTANPLTVKNVKTVQNITANFAINTYKVTPEAAVGGSLSPSTVQTVSYGETTSFTITPDANYHIVSATGCEGKLSGEIYTTDLVTADCAITMTLALPDGNLGNGGTLDDVYTAMLIAAGSMPATPDYLLHGDVAPFVNGEPQPDGKIDIGDVVVMLRKALGLVNW